MVRKRGKTAGTTDSYWTNPDGKRFRSIKEIERFLGYELPVQYAGAGVLKEHMHCRAPGKASVFDVGHMGQIKWPGADRAAFLEKCVVGDIKGLGAGEGRLSLLTNESGGILDDTVITNAGDYVYMVVNGATKHDDMAHFKKQMATFDGEVEMEMCSERFGAGAERFGVLRVLLVSHRARAPAA